MAQTGHEGALHAAGFFGQPAPPREIERKPADGKHARQAQQGIEQAHVALLQIGVVHIGFGVLADADAAEHLAHLAALVATQAAILRHKHVEQAQFALSVRFRSAEDFPRPLRTLAKGVGLPGVSLVFGAQGHIADDTDANTRLRISFSQLAAHIGGIHEHKGAPVRCFHGAFGFGQPGIGLAVCAFQHIDAAVDSIPVAGVHKLSRNGG